MPRERTNAQLGDFTFHEDFSDPVVDVTHDARTVSHETINGDNIIQVMGRDPPNISIEGVAYDFQLETADELLEKDEIPFFSDRWTGMVVVESVDTAYRREAEPGTGDWVYDLNIDLLGVKDYIDMTEDTKKGGATTDVFAQDPPRRDIHPSDRRLYEAAERFVK